ncbi:MAG: 16S rRNA (uracil(1498)-N(3))-methyltransferase [Clostridia bacterium]|nr:16S rRNA (uracil(1498)-N(3))-methyltransferase [Clostridia bacterium]
MQKFFVNSDQIKEDEINIIGEDVNHIANVLRLNAGEEVLVGDKTNGASYLCNIKSINKNEVLLNILQTNDKTTEPNIYIHLFQGLPKADKMESIIQKCTEVGVSEFTPVIMNRCVAKLEGKDSNKKIERWQKIAETAAKQSKRDIIPKINFAENLKNVYENLEKYDIVLVAYEDECEKILKNELQQYKKQNSNIKKIAIIIGPEGGLEKQEVELMKQQRWNCGFTRKKNFKNRNSAYSNGK